MNTNLHPLQFINRLINRVIHSVLILQKIPHYIPALDYPNKHVLLYFVSFVFVFVVLSV